MNEEQLGFAKAHFDELKYGMKNIDVKALGLRQFCRYVQRKRNKKVYSLYALTPEWERYVESQNKPETNSDFSSIVQEVSAIKTSNDSLSLMSEIEYSIIHGDCILRERNLTERVAILYKYYNKLKDEGMEDIDIVRADLVGMIGPYLVPTINDKRKLRTDAQIYVLSIIYKYYNKDIGEYRAFICEIYNEFRLKSGARKLTHIPVHLFKAIFHFKPIPSEITYEEAWKLVNDMKSNSEISHKFSEEKWNKELEKCRMDSISDTAKLCLERMKEYEKHLRHPFVIDCRTLIGLIYVIIAEDELGHYDDIKGDSYLLEKIKQIDWHDISILEASLHIPKY